MYLQTVIERNTIALSRNSTYKLDLPKSGLLSSLHIFLDGDMVSNHSQTGGNWRLIDFISKIEVLANSSTPIKSLTGRQAQAIAFWSTGKTAGDTWRNYASNTDFASILLLFGRKLHDPQMALDLSRYNNVSLEITNTIATTNYSDTVSIVVVATYLRDVSAAQILGYIRTEEYRNWLTVQAAWQYNDIPVELPIRRLYLQSDPAHGTANAADTQFTNLAYDIRLALRTRQLDVYRGSASQWMRLNYYQAPGEQITNGKLSGDADVGFRHDIGAPWAIVGAVAPMGGAVGGTFPSVTGGDSADTMRMENASTSDPIYFLVRGQGYMNTLCFPFDQSDDPSTWLDPEAQKQVTLDVQTRDSATADNGYNRIVMERFVA